MLPIVGAALVATAIPVAWWAVSGPQRLGIDPSVALRRGARPTDLRDLELQPEGSARLTAPIVALLATVSRWASPASAVDRVEQRLAAAGLAWPIERFFAAKLLLLGVGGVAGVLRLAVAPSLAMFVLAGLLMAGGWFLPDVILRDRATARIETVRRALPDTIDQVTIAVEAGLGFEAALARAVSGGEGPLADEVNRTLQDIQLGVPRADALGNLAKRMELPELHRLVSAIQQSERYGVPIANVLRVQAGELRDRRRQRAEEHAMKIPVKVVLPLVLCILPALFIVVLGPAVMRLMESGVGG